MSILMDRFSGLLMQGLASGGDKVMAEYISKESRSIASALLVERDSYLPKFSKDELGLFDMYVGMAATGLAARSDAPKDHGRKVSFISKNACVIALEMVRSRRG